MTFNKENIITKQYLKRTWSSFFVRFGGLLPVQMKAIPLVLKGHDLILVSSTASGKTEAVVAPICEKIIKNRIYGLSTLYLTPTRALANDIHYRLTEQLSNLDIQVSIKTGDKPYFNKKKLPDILITTPESLDSLLCRHPDSLNMINFLIIDEIHLIDNTYRGDQLRILIKRLKKLTSDFNTYLLSATVSSPEELGKRYMEVFEVIQTEQSREIAETYITSFDELFELAKEEKLRKLLVFCNSRVKTESVGNLLKEIWGSTKVVVHHGSLSKAEREDAEIFMKSCREGVCVSTMTLEIGIDIGDIDAAVLAEVPWDDSSFIQRIGRAGRKKGVIRVFLIDDMETTNDYENMINIARGNTLTEQEYVFDLSVVIQQIFSILFANPMGVDEDYFYHLFSDFCDIQEVANIISNLLENGHIIKRMDNLYASELTMNLGEKGQIHSNISNTKACEVFNIGTNKKIGEIKVSEDLSKTGKCFMLGGRAWQIVKVNKSRVHVKPSTSNSISSASFGLISQHGTFFDYLPPELKQSNE